MTAQVVYDTKTGKWVVHTGFRCVNPFKIIQRPHRRKMGDLAIDALWLNRTQGAK